MGKLAITLSVIAATLRKILIPDSITDIGKYAFAGCSALKEILV